MCLLVSELIIFGIFHMICHIKKNAYMFLLLALPLFSLVSTSLSGTFSYLLKDTITEVLRIWLTFNPRYFFLLDIFGFPSWEILPLFWSLARLLLDPILLPVCLKYFSVWIFCFLSCLYCFRPTNLLVLIYPFSKFTKLLSFTEATDLIPLSLPPYLFKYRVSTILMYSVVLFILVLKLVVEIEMGELTTMWDIVLIPRFSFWMLSVNWKSFSSLQGDAPQSPRDTRTSPSVSMC